MKTYLDCIPCFTRQALQAAKLSTSDPQIHERILRETLKLASVMDLNQSPPQMAQKIHRYIRKLIKNKDPYLKLKNDFNEHAIKLLPEMQKIVSSSDDPLKTAIKLSIAGNIIDFGVRSVLNKHELDQTIRECLETEISSGLVAAFRQQIESADNILFLADNAGEIVFDRLLIELLPTHKVTVAVKGSPIINDATKADAKAAGITDIVKVIDNGSDAPGTILETCSDSFISNFNNSELVISKGQGNYETLSGINKNIYFMLKAKCPVIASHIPCNVGDLVFMNKKLYTNSVKTKKISVTGPDDLYIKKCRTQFK